LCPKGCTAFGSMGCRLRARPRKGRGGSPHCGWRGGGGSRGPIASGHRRPLVSACWPVQGVLRGGVRGAAGRGGWGRGGIRVTAWSLTRGRRSRVGGMVRAEGALQERELTGMGHRP